MAVTFSYSLSSLSREMLGMVVLWTARKQDHAVIHKMCYRVVEKELLHIDTERRH